MDGPTLYRGICHGRSGKAWTVFAKHGTKNSDHVTKHTKQHFSGVSRQENKEKEAIYVTIHPKHAIPVYHDKHAPLTRSSPIDTKFKVKFTMCTKYILERKHVLRASKNVNFHINHQHEVHYTVILYTSCKTTSQGNKHTVRDARNFHENFASRARFTGKGDILHHDAGKTARNSASRLGEQQFTAEMAAILHRKRGM